MVADGPPEKDTKGGKRKRGPPSRGPPSGPPVGPSKGPQGGPPGGPSGGPPVGPSGAPSRGPPSSQSRGPPTGAFDRGGDEEPEPESEPEIEPEPEPVEQTPAEPPAKGPPSRGPPRKGPPRSKPARGPPVSTPEVDSSEESEMDQAISKIAGDSEDSSDLHEAATEDAGSLGDWEEPEEEEDLPEVDPLPTEPAEGSRYPKLTLPRKGKLKDSPLTGHIIPHTHWDRAWYLPFQKYRYRLIEFVDDLLDLMENNPKAFPTFELDGQTVIIEDYLEVKPQNEERIRKLVKKGRLNIGPWYVLPDEYIVGGEALARNLLMGHRTAERYGGRSEVGYVPDPFGHVSQLPAILAGAGLDSFIFTRGAGPWIQAAGGVFNWYASDGKTKVLSVKQVPDYPNLMAWGFENRPLDRKDSLDVDVDSAMDKMQRLLDKHEEIDWKPNVLLFGQGSDHTHPQPTLPMLIGKANNKFNGVCRFEHSSFTAYIEALRGWLGRKKVYRFEGELHSGWDRNVLSGVFSSRLYQKRANDHTMRLLRDQVEQLSAVSQAHDGRDRTARIESAWREVLRNHPHDDICGCSVDETHDDMDVRFKHAQQISAMLIDDVSDELRTQMDLTHDDRDAIPLIFHNPLPKSWSGTLQLDIAVPKYRCWLDSGGSVKVILASPAGDCILHTADLEVQPKSHDLHVHPDRVANVELPRIVGRIQVHRIPSGLTVAHALPGRGLRTLPGEPVTIGGEFGRTDWIDNGLVRILFRADGRFDVMDHSSGRHIPGIGRLEDCEDAGDSYDWSPAGYPVPVGEGSGDKMMARIEASDKRLSDVDEANRQVYLTVEHQDEWTATVRLHVAWALPARFDDATQSRSSDLEWLTVDHYITIRSGHRMIEVESWVNNPCEDHRLRLHVPTGCDVNRIHAGGAYDVIERPCVWPHHADWEQPHVLTQHFSDLLIAQEKDGGVAVFCPGSNEYEGIPGGIDGEGTTFAITLLRATGHLSRDGFASRRNRAGPTYTAPGAQCKGSHYTRWAVMAFEDSWAESDVHQISETFSCQASVIPAHGKPQLDGEFDEPCTRGARGRRVQPIRLVGDGPMPVISCLKPAADGNGTVVRLYNPTSEAWEGRIETDLPLFNIRGCDLLERESTKPRISKSGWPAKIPAGAIRSWRFN